MTPTKTGAKSGSSKTSTTDAPSGHTSVVKETKHDLGASTSAAPAADKYPPKDTGVGKVIDTPISRAENIVAPRPEVKPKPVVDPPDWSVNSDALPDSSGKGKYTEVTVTAAAGSTSTVVATINGQNFQFSPAAAARFAKQFSKASLNA